MPLFTACVCKRAPKGPKVSPPLHLLLQPNTLEAQRHVFKAKKVKKSRPCHVCHQPIVKLGSCCRVCKYLVHKACEPKEAASEAPRSFTDPARQIFYELRATAARPGPRGPSSLQGSPLSPRRRSPGGTAPPSLQPSPTLTRHAGGSPLRQDPGEATGAASPARTSSPGQLRRGGCAGPTPSQGGSPRVSQRESSPAPGAASLGTGEGSRASAPRESEGVGLTRIHHAPVNSPVMNQPPAPPPRRNVAKLFRRQNSFAGFPSAALSIFNNNASNNNNNNNNGKSSSKPVPTPASTAPETSTTDSSTAQTCTASGAASVPTSAAPPVSGPSSLPMYQPPPAASRPPTGFYSLPRHNRPGYLTRSLGIGFHLLARTPQGGSSGPTAAEQLGINTPSLPKSHRRNLSEGNNGEAKPLSVSSLTRKGSSSRDAQQSGGEPKLKSSSSSSKRSSRDGGDGKPRRRDPDYQTLPRRSAKDASSKRSPKEGDAKGQSSRREVETKFRSLPRRHEGEARYQAIGRSDPKYQSLPKRHSSAETRFTAVPKKRDGDPTPPPSSSPKRRVGDSTHSSSSPKRRESLPNYIPSSPKRRDTGPDHGHAPLSPKRRDTMPSHMPSSPKKGDAAPSVSPIKHEMSVEQQTPKQQEVVQGPQQTMSPKRRVSEPKYQQITPKRYDFDPKYQVLPTTGIDGEPTYHIHPPKRPDVEPKYPELPPKRYDIGPKYQTLPHKRYNYDSKYHSVPHPLPRHDIESKYETVPLKRHDHFDQRYHRVLPPTVDLRYHPLPPRRCDPGPRYQTIPPVRHDVEHRHHYIPHPRNDESKFQPIPMGRPDLEPKYQPLPAPRPELEPKYQPLPAPRPELEPKYQPLPAPRPELEPKYQPLPAPRPELEPKYQPLPAPRPDLDPKYQPLPAPRPDLEPKYQPPPAPRPHLEPKFQPIPVSRPDLEQKFQPIPAPRPDLEAKFQPIPAPRPELEPKFQPIPAPRPELEPKFQPIPAPRPEYHTAPHCRPDLESKYQPLPPRRPDQEPKYQPLPPGRPDLEPKYQPLPPRPDIEPKYQPLPPRPDIEPKYQMLPHERPDIEPKYQPLPPKRPDIEPRYHQHMPPGRPDVEPKYQPLPQRRPDIEPKYQPLPPRRPDIEPKYHPPPLRRPDIEPKFQPLPPPRPDIEPKYQPLPPRRPDIEPSFPPQLQRRPDIEPKYQPLPPRRPDIEPKFQPPPVSSGRPDLEPKYQQMLPKTHDYEFQPIPCVKPSYDPRDPAMAPRRTDYAFHTIPTIRSENEPKFQPMPIRRPEVERIPFSIPVSVDSKPPLDLPKPYNGDPKFHTGPPRPTEAQPGFQMVPPRTRNGESTYQTGPLKVQVTEPHLRQNEAPLYETLPAKLHTSELLNRASLPPKPCDVETYGQPVPPKFMVSHQTSPKAADREPLYQMIAPKVTEREPLYQKIAPKVSESLYCTAPVKPEDDDGPPYTVMSPKICEPPPPPYQTKPSDSRSFFPPPSPDPADEAPVYQAVTPEMIQDVKSNYRLLQARKLEKEMLKLQGVPKRIKGDKYHSPTKRTFREGDSKYQSFPKRAHKGEPKYQSLPKKKDKEGEAKSKKEKESDSKSKKKEKEKDSESKYQALPKSKEKEGESKYETLRRERPIPPPVRWSPGDDDGIYSSLEYPSEGPRSEGALSDDIYSSIETTDGDPLYQSVGEAKYSRPQPPLPAPLRYRRRADDAPPPLPPPRLTTGPVGPHNPLISPGSIPPPIIPERGPILPGAGMRASYPGTTSTTPSPDNLLMVQSTPTWPQTTRAEEEDDVYSSIPSLISSTPDSPPATLPRTAPVGRVAPSASWNSLGSSCKSSLDSLRSDGSTNVRQRRRRARSDPRMDAGVLHRLAFTVWHTALHIEKENNNDATATQKHPTISSRNTQSAARLNRVMAGAGGATGGGLAGEAPGPGGERPGPPGGGPKMDVVYVTERIISLAFPPALDDATYTLHLREVAHMLSSKHGDNFKVFNLSQHGEISHFLPRVMELGWADQLAPALERLCSICKALDSWITQHPQHVAVLHARGGYEKLGVVVAAYMHYSNICASTDQALDRYAMKRFFDDKIGQLYHPSQKRYVQYFAGLLSGVIRINSSPLYLHTLTLYGIPHFEPRGGCHLFIKIYQGMTPIYTSGIYNLTEQMRQVTIAFETGVQLRGDILLKAYHRRLVPASREVIFRMQFHTCAVSEKVLSFTRHDLDDACNDMRFPLDGGVELYFTHSQDERPRTVSNVSCDKSPCAIASWNSYENVSFTYEQIEEQGVTGVGGVSHTLGPLDGSLYATVTKKRPQPPASPHSPVSPHAPSVTHTPSPHGLVNGRYAASIDSGIASSNSAAAAPVSPPTSDTSRTSGESRGTAAAAVTAGRVGAGVAPPPVDARQLDELLQGMLLDIQSIPDLRPSQTPAPDIDSIRCPDFSMAPKTESRPSVTARSSADTAPPPPLSPVNGFSGSTTHDSLLDSSLSTTADEMPYHARTDSKPFSYGAVTSSPLLGRRRTASEGGEGGAQPPPSPSIHRRNSRETLGQARAGLESPRLVRRMSGSVGGTPGDAGGGSRRSPSPSPSPEPGSRGGTLGRQRSHTLTTRIMSGSETTPNSTLNRSEHTRSASRLDDTLDLSSEFHTRSLSSTGSNNLSWLQMQQLKLAERREAKLRAERAPHEARMLSELRTRMGQQQRTSTTTSRDFEDGYVSDTTLLSETSRESSPVKTLAPLTINTGGPQTTPQKPPIGHSTPARGNSAPSSPILPTRSASRERTVRYNQQQSSQRSLPRKHSDSSHDRERPFVAVKRAHENAKPGEPGDASSALNQLQTSPHGHIQYSSYSSTTPVDGGLLTTVASSSNQEGLDSLDALSATLASLGSPTHPPTSTSPPNPISSTTTVITTSAVTTTAESREVLTAQTSQSRDDSAWQSDTESSYGGNRPITPGFPPATPTTPYLNQGLPPKSPTMQRRAHLGLSSLSSRPIVKKSASLPSKEMGVRSPSPATSQTLRQELNGHSSPAPSLYHSQSRRSSLTSLNESSEVISSHPKFVKDISKFWYKPTITRDEAISMLKDKAPGTFVVRDSNSFPGAFGLALKVSTPPPNVTSKSSDPASELVRHFLIEPTSRGVRLKGCANEPVFGSLSALVYQHSITALALPCRLVLPERDPAGAPDSVDSSVSTSGSSSSTSQLLQQGAACNVMYLHTADTESLTGPQAVKRAVSLMLAAKITPTVVHFKVSAQGITLTDNERKLFFRRHYPVNTISHCGLDPDDRRWAQKNEEGVPVGSHRVFGFVAKKGASRTENQCHILAELEPEQPATAICNFVTKVMMTSVSRPNLV